MGVILVCLVLGGVLFIGDNSTHSKPETVLSLSQTTSERANGYTVSGYLRTAGIQSDGIAHDTRVKIIGPNGSVLERVHLGDVKLNSSNPYHYNFTVNTSQQPQKVYLEIDEVNHHRSDTKLVVEGQERQGESGWTIVIQSRETWSYDLSELDYRRNRLLPTVTNGCNFMLGDRVLKQKISKSELIGAGQIR